MLLKLSHFARRIIDTPRTSIPGLVMVLTAIGTIAGCPKCLFKPETATPIISGLVAGVGLLGAADSKREDKRENE